MATWFTSDTHFGHTNIIDLSGRPFASVDEMDRVMVSEWNATVDETDTVYHLGDFGFHKGANAMSLAEIFDQLNGRKHLVVGNHDHKHVTRLPWETKSDLSYVKVNGQRFVLCHYPIEDWRSARRGCIHLHGHTHGNMIAERIIGQRFDVGVDDDTWGTRFRPVSFDQVTDRARSDSPYQTISHH